MAPFAAIELHERAAAHGLVIDVGQGMEGLLDATKLRDALAKIPHTDKIGQGFLLISIVWTSPRKGRL